MELVIDSNYLISPELEIYFRKSKNNKVVLISDLQNEASQTVDLDIMRALTKTLTKYPNQVISLKSTSKICGLSGRSKGLKKRLIHKRSSAGFRAFSDFMNSKYQPNSDMGKTLLQDANIKKEIIFATKNDAGRFLSAFEKTEKEFTKEEVSTIRKHPELKKDIHGIFFKLVSALAAQHYKSIPNRGKWPRDEEWPNQFLFRLSLFHTLYFFNWVSKGSPKKMNLEKIGNDLIDLNFCTYATYFDGLLTKDKRCMEIFEEGNALLKAITSQYLEAELK